jgi:DNA-binding NarL/FixJ family response regulator
MESNQPSTRTSGDPDPFGRAARQRTMGDGRAGVTRPPYRVAVVDGHPMARWGIAAALATADDLRVVADAADANQLTDLASYDVVTLDVEDNPLPSFLDVIASVATVVPVLMVSASQAPGTVLAAVRAGAMGYVTKGSATNLLVGAVRVVAERGFAFSPDLARLVRRAFVALPEPPCGPAAALSPREAQALRLIARGLTYGQVANRMGVRKTAVDAYVERIRVRLRVGSDRDLARLADDSDDSE